MNRIIFLLLLIPGSKNKNRYGEQPLSGFWDGSYMVVDPLNISVIKSKLKKQWANLIGDKGAQNKGVSEEHNSTELTVDFMDVLYKVLIKEPLNFAGRSSRDELMIFSILFSIISMCLSYIISFMTYDYIVVIQRFIEVIFAIPFISLIIRRLHDGYNSGLWIFFLLVPVLNVYVLYLIFFKPSFE